MTITFDSNDGAGDAEYLQWLHDHPAGSVLNSRRWYDPTYMVLHKATCHLISKPTSRMGEHPFTGRGYIKVCSEDPDALLVWIKHHGGLGFSKRCALCGA